MHKYAQICLNMQKICKYVQGLKLILFCENMQDICKIYTRICRVCKQGFYMQYMQIYAFPTLLMQPAAGYKQLSLRPLRLAPAGAGPGVSWASRLTRGPLGQPESRCRRDSDVATVISECTLRHPARLTQCRRAHAAVRVRGTGTV
jgi:hypothetical protein